MDVKLHQRTANRDNFSECLGPVGEDLTNQDSSLLSLSLSNITLALRLTLGTETRTGPGTQVSVTMLTIQDLRGRNYPHYIFWEVFPFIIQTEKQTQKVSRKERKIQTLFKISPLTEMLFPYSQHFWHQTCGFSTSNSPVLCRHQLGVLQFNSTVTLPRVNANPTW